MATRIILPCDELRRLYLEDGLGVAQVALRLGCSAATISNRLRACGIAARSGRFAASRITLELLTQLYTVEGLPVAVIAARLGVSVGTIHNRRRAFGIPARRAGIAFGQAPFGRGKRLRENSLHFYWV
jgi:transcriptional regulator of aromatic amino acid metabolism